MNPSHFPQVIRARSRSPSPVSRRRVASDVKERSTLTPHPERTSFGSQPVIAGSAAGSSRVSYGATQHEARGQFLTVPQSGTGDSSSKQRSSSDVLTQDLSSRGRHSQSQRRREELSDMAAVEVVSSTQHSINDGNCDSDDQLTTSTQETEAPHTLSLPTTQPLGDRPAPKSSHTSANGSPRGRSGRRSSSKKPLEWSAEQVEQHRRWLKFFFMDPYNKFKARRHIPWKMMLQFIKIIIITVQIVQFGGQRSNIVEYFEHNQRTLQHLLLKDWDPSYETMPYPAATGVYALYSVDDLLDYIQFSWKQYYNLSDASLAPITLLRLHDSDEDNNTFVPIRLCNSLNNFKTYPNGSYVVGPGVVHNCTDLVPLNGTEPYNIRKFLVQNNITIPFRKLLDLSLDFSYDTFHLNLIETHYGPICYRVNTTIRFENYERSGQILIHMITQSTQRDCPGRIISKDAKSEEDMVRMRSVGFDSFVIAICVLSTLLCIRSLYRAIKLKRITERMFCVRFGVKLDLSDRMEFINFWYLLIIINDVFTVIGAAYKIKLETRAASLTSSNYDYCSVMLGLGGLLAWMGVLRYLSFFSKYNILIVTLKTAFPNVIRFSLCALAMYCGFMFCGWVILGPYHIKFRHMSTTSECLFSLVNGDDMFVTFSATETKNLLVWYFSRIYLYTFISLFIYCVLSLFIAVIMDTYETIKQGYSEECRAHTRLWRFIDECNLPVHSGLYRRQHTESSETKDWSFIDFITSLFHRKMKKEAEGDGESTHLLAQTI